MVRLFARESSFVGRTRRMIRLIDVKARCRNLKQFTCKGTLRQVFIRVYRLEIDNFLGTFNRVGIFNPACDLYSSLLSGSTLPPSLPSLHVNKYSIQCVRGVVQGSVGDHNCRSFALCIWQNSEPTILLDQPKQKSRRGGGFRQINTCRKVPSQVNFFTVTFCIAYESYLSTGGSLRFFLTAELSKGTFLAAHGRANHLATFILI
jgi:hypothetical protein